MPRVHFVQRDSNGAPVSGISHSTSVSRYDDNTAGPTVLVSEVSAGSAAGCYFFDVTASKVLYVVTDAGSGVTDDKERYRSFVIQPDADEVTLGNIADAVWDEATSGHTTSGSFGEAATALTAADVADAVWDEATSGHTTSGSFGEAATALTAADVADAVWDEATSGHTTSGSFGEAVTVLKALCGLNRSVISTTYSGTPPRPTSQTIGIYANSTDANADTNRIATITVTRDFDATGRPTTVKATG